MKIWATTVLVLALVQWLVCILRYALSVRRKQIGANPERNAILSTALLAVCWTATAPPWNIGISEASRGLTSRRPCAGLRPGLSTDEARTAMGAPSRVVQQNEVRGAGAELWIYDDARCAAHFFSGRIEHLEYEGDLSANADMAGERR